MMGLAMTGVMKEPYVSVLFSWKRVDFSYHIPVAKNIILCFELSSSLFKQRKKNEAIKIHVDEIA